jgi:pimeloyl-ACP methyl ester carboxylesterase
MNRPIAAAWIALLLQSAGTAAFADHQVGHTQPVGPAAREFAADFPELADSEWGFPIGGFGGTAQGEAPDHVPVIFVHGNNVDACDWKLVRDDFRAAGWSDQSLWALSYNGLGNNVGNEPSRPDPRCNEEHAARNGGDSASRITANDINVADLHAFIAAVRAYTGSPRFSIVAHSLGVTVARKTLKDHPELRQDLVAFVAIAGANHGTSLCPPGSAGVVHSCDEISPGSAWLEALNGPDGNDETYAPAKWLTIYDGSGAGDVAYTPDVAQSPALKGADNRQFPGTSHNALRVNAEIVAEYRRFLEEAEAGAAGSGGGGAVSLWLLGLVSGARLGALVGKRRRQAVKLLHDQG